MSDAAIATDIRGHVLCIGFTRPEKRNAFDVRMYRPLAQAYGRLENENGLRCVLLYADGDHFTDGLDRPQ